MEDFNLLEYSANQYVEESFKFPITNYNHNDGWTWFYRTHHVDPNSRWYKWQYSESMDLYDVDSEMNEKLESWYQNIWLKGYKQKFFNDLFDGNEPMQINGSL